MKTKSKLGLLLLLSLTLLLPGCIADDLSNCGISVHFRYIKNVSETDLFAEQVNRITLFIFDDEGRYIDSRSESGAALSESGYRMNIGLERGRYTLVAWGNLEEEYELPEFTPQSSHIDEVLLSLRCLDNMVEDHPSHLFFGRDSIEIVPDNTGRTNVLMDLMKDTNTIRVTLRGLPLEEDYADESGVVTPLMPYRCAITSVNRSYNFDNTIAGDDRLTYIPAYHLTPSDNVVKTGFVTLRELNDGSTGSRLTVHDTLPTRAGSNDGLLLDVSLTELLIAASVTNDLDIDDLFEIEIEFDYTAGTATIFINGWVYGEEEWSVG